MSQEWDCCENENVEGVSPLFLKKVFCLPQTTCYIWKQIQTKSINNNSLNTLKLFAECVVAAPWSASVLTCKTPKRVIDMNILCSKEWQKLGIELLFYRVMAEARNRRSLEWGRGRSESAKTADCSLWCGCGGGE